MYFDVRNADQKLLAIMGDREQHEVWSELQSYVERAG